MKDTLFSSTADTIRQPDLDKLPNYCDRKTGAGLIEEYYFPISPRSLERWSLPWRRVNGHAICPTRALLEEARRRFEAALITRGGRNAAVEDTSRFDAAEG